MRPNQREYVVEVCKPRSRPYISDFADLKREFGEVVATAAYDAVHGGKEYSHADIKFTPSYSWEP